MLTNRRTRRVAWIAAASALSAWTAGCGGSTVGEIPDSGNDSATDAPTGLVKDAGKDAAVSKDASKPDSGHDGGGAMDAPADQSVPPNDVVTTVMDTGTSDSGKQDSGKDAGPTTSIGVTPLVLDFSSTGNAAGLVSCGTSPGTQTFSVTNTGTSSIEWWTAFGLGAATPYQVSSSCLEATPCTIAPGAAATVVTVTGPPVAANAGIAAFNDTLTVFSSAPGDNGHVIQLNEQSYGAILTFSPTDENFGMQPTSGTYNQTIQVLNAGNAPAAATLAVATGSSSEFTISGTALAVPVAGAPFTATYQPGTDTTAESGQVSITAPATSICGPLPPNLTLEGQGTVALLAVTPSLNFNSGANGNGGIGVSCGTAGPTLNAVITNTGTNSATVTGATLGLGANSPYTLTTTTGTVNANGGTLSIPVAPNPIAATSAPNVNLNDTLTITTSAGTYTVALNETSAGAVLNLVPATVAFNNTPVNQQSIYGMSLTNSGNVAAPVTFASSNAVFTFDKNVVGTASTSVFPNAYFTPTMAQGYTGAGTMTVTTGTPMCSSNPTTVDFTLTGTGNNGDAYGESPARINFAQNTCGVNGAVGTPPASSAVTLSNKSVSAATWTATLGGANASLFTLSASTGSVPAESGATPGTTSFMVNPVALGSGSGLTANQVEFGLTATVTVTVGTGTTADTFTVQIAETPYGAFPIWSVGSVSVRQGQSANFALRNVSTDATTFTLTTGANSGYTITAPTGNPPSGQASLAAPLAATIKNSNLITNAATTTVTAALATPATSPLCGPLPAPLAVNP